MNLRVGKPAGEDRVVRGLGGLGGHSGEEYESDDHGLILGAIRNEGQVVLFKVGNMRIGEVLHFAANQIATITEFLSSEDQVLVLRS